jgi:ketosteroid isomerase-like protein
MAVAAESSQPSTAQSEGERFVERFADVWGRSDLEGVLSLIADDAVLYAPTLPTAHGKVAARDSFTRLFRAFPDLTATVHGWAAHDDVVFIEFTLKCTFGGRELSWPAVDRFVLRDRLVAERINYFDPLALSPGQRIRVR